MGLELGKPHPESREVAALYVRLVIDEFKTSRFSLALEHGLDRHTSWIVRILAMDKKVNHLGRLFIPTGYDIATGCFRDRRNI